MTAFVLPRRQVRFVLTRNNCGTGAGGFKPGNTCAKGGGNSWPAHTPELKKAAEQRYLKDLAAMPRELAFPKSGEGRGLHAYLSSPHASMNAHLRGEKPEFEKDSSGASWEELTAGFDSYLEARAGAVAPPELYRGFRHPDQSRYVDEMEAAAESGSPVVLGGGYQSMTSLPTIAETFGSKGFDPEPRGVLLKVASKSAVAVDRNWDNDEMEYVPPRDRAYRVKSVTRGVTGLLQRDGVADIIELEEVGTGKDHPDAITVNDCGTGAGGFKPGNTCAAGGGTGERVTGRKLKAARAIAREKFKAKAKPDKEAVAKAREALDRMGADLYQNRIKGNSRDRAASRQKLIDEFGDGKSCPCLYCGLKLTKDTVTRDKIYTAREGGRYTQDNLVPACLPCNKQRGDKPFRSIKW